MGIAKEQILVVDDEEDLRQAIVEILTVDGFEVHGVASAEEAQEMLSQTAYDVLITDNNLPGKSGVELLEETLARYPGNRRHRHHRFRHHRNRRSGDQEGRLRLPDQAFQAGRTLHHGSKGT